jgi:hypothetical protein
MGFLINRETAFIGSANMAAFPDQKRLRFSNVDLSFLVFIKDYFEGYLFYHAGITYMNGPSNGSLQTISTPLVDHLFDV